MRADTRIEKHSITAIVDLLKEDDRVVGAWGVNYQNGTLVTYRASETILCTGGGSGLFYVNDNPPQVTGDGYVLGFRAGVPLLGIEMIDFQAMCCSPKELFGFAPHPTGFINAGAVFRNRAGEEFLKRYFPETAEQSTRSEVILAMAKEIHAGRAASTGGIFMDATKVPMEVIAKQIPHVYRTCLHRGIDITRTPLEVAPGSHTWLGGLKVDADGKTPVAGLFAAGETAGGIHGGNRIGGSALSASLVYGRRAGRKAAALVKEARVDVVRRRLPSRSANAHGLRISCGARAAPCSPKCACAAACWRTTSSAPSGMNARSKRRLRNMSIERGDVPGMRLDPAARASDKVRGDELESALSVRNLALLGRILATAALARAESRGAAFQARLSRDRRPALACRHAPAIGPERRNRVLHRSGEGAGSTPSPRIAGRGSARAKREAGVRGPNMSKAAAQIRVSGLAKRYGTLEVFRGIDFDVGERRLSRSSAPPGAARRRCCAASTA